MTTTSDATHLYDLPILDRMAEHCVPGVSVAIINDGQVAEEHVYGDRTADTSSPVTPTTLFQACSISKPVTAMGMLRLVEQGRLDLDADVNDHLKSWRVPANGGWQPRVTLRQIVSHSAGLTAHGFPGYPRGQSLPTLVQVLSGIAPANTEGVRVDIAPGVQFRYSGGGTTVMQLLLEEVTGVAIAELLRELVLEPLRMEHSTFEQPLPDARSDEAATAHHTDGSPIEGDWHTYPEQGAAGLWTTPGDLIRFALGIQRAVAGGVDGPISTAMAEQMLTAQTPPTPGADRIGGLNAVGLGPFVRWEEGRTTYFGHSGGNEGFRCHLMAHRDDGVGAAVMTNSDSGSWVVMDAFNAIAREHAWPGYVSEPFDAPPPRGPGLDQFTGVFVLPSGVRLDVTRVGDQLNVVVGDQPVIPFSAEEETKIVSQYVDSTLALSADGSLVLHQSDVDTPCRRVSE